MMDLDFLPIWYAQQRRRESRLRQWKVLLALAACCVGVWSFVAGQALVHVKAQAIQAQQAVSAAQSKLDTALQMQYQIALCDRKINLLKKLTPTTSFSAVLAELSALDCPNVAFTQVQLRRQPIALPEKTDGVVRIRRSDKPDTASFEQPTELVVTIQGLAVNGADCARLMEQLEASVYFDNVQPTFSRDKSIGQQTAAEFEVRARTADWRWKR